MTTIWVIKGDTRSLDYSSWVQARLVTTDTCTFMFSLPFSTPDFALRRDITCFMPDAEMISRIPALGGREGVFPSATDGLDGKLSSKSPYQTIHCAQWLSNLASTVGES